MRSLPLLLALAAGCDPGAPPPDPGAAPAERAPASEAASPRSDGDHPFLLIGVDGAEWSVVRELWAEGKLPNLKRFCEAGVCGETVGEYSASPIIWTTIATGALMERHGIDSFTTRSEDGKLAPVSATLRKVPAIWNMLSSAQRKVGVLGWWVTWPAEAVNGVLYTARADKGDFDDRVYPPEAQARFDAEREEATRDQSLFKRCDQFASNDAWVGHYGQELLRAGDYDLVMAYFRCIDVVSHQYWAPYQPEKFPEVNPQDVKAFGEVIPTNYEATDLLVGELLEAAGPDVNVILASDHGFYAEEKEQIVVRVLMDRVFEYLGYSELVGDEPDLSKSQVYAYNSRPKRRRQLIRFARAGREEGGTVTPDQTEAIRERLAADLKKFTYTSGASVFKLRYPPKDAEAELGADFVVQVFRERAGRELLYDGEPVDRELIGVITRQSGNHHKPIPPGLFMAMGPDIDPEAPLSEVRIQDFTPTLLYGLGLPVAEDFDGEPVQALFTEPFRSAHELKTISTWGGRGEAGASTSEADGAMLDELRQLGYIE